jgi:hypothetical protein
MEDGAGGRSYWLGATDTAARFCESQNSALSGAALASGYF